jgi:hypothetical protein
MIGYQKILYKKEPDLYSQALKSSAITKQSSKAIHHIT